MIPQLKAGRSSMALVFQGRVMLLQRNPGIIPRCMKRSEAGKVSEVPFSFTMVQSSKLRIFIYWNMWALRKDTNQQKSNWEEGTRARMNDKTAKITPSVVKDGACLFLLREYNGILDNSFQI